MRRIASIAVSTTAIVCMTSPLQADPLSCNLSAYKAVQGLTATLADDTLSVTWDGERSQEVRLNLILVSGTPTIRELAVRTKGGQWSTLATNVTPEYKVTTGFRRATLQQLNPLKSLGVPITPAVIDKIKWEAFWDAPLRVPGGEAAHGNATPPPEGIANQPGLPRRPEEVARAAAVFKVTGCDVKTDGGRIEVSFPGVQLGVFAGRLDYTVYKGSNLIRQMVVAKTDAPSVAYTYLAGLKGLTLNNRSRMVWRANVSGQWTDYRFGGTKNDDAVPLKTANRVVAAEGPAGTIVAFPPPHTFFWARETEFNLGYNWYRKDSETTYSFGVKQADHEETPDSAGHGAEDTSQNFALYSARPGTDQRMQVFFYVSPEAAQAAMQGALNYTRNDTFKPLPGYQTMATHFHTSMISRLNTLGGLDARLPDFDLMKATGINIFAPIDGGGGLSGGSPIGGARGATPPQGRGAGAGARGAGAGPGGARGGGGDQGEGEAPALPAGRTIPPPNFTYLDVVLRHSDKNFFIMPNQEGGLNLGGHTDLVYSHPVRWTNGRLPGQAMMETDAQGKVYHITTPDEFMAMAKAENILAFMPHPRSKGSTGFPDAIKDKSHFLHDNYRGIGFRWGMGHDGSEIRMCEYRCFALLDDMNNWVADLPLRPKFAWAISETYRKGPGDDIYANNPVNYVKMGALPTSTDWSSIVNPLMSGDFFWTSGEILITNYAVAGAGNARTITADVEWTFPLDFVEVVWGDGTTTDRRTISATDLPAFGTKRFSIPFDATGKKWVRFAAFDSAGNGAFVQPIKLPAAVQPAAR